MRLNKIKTFYNPKQVLSQDESGNFSKSPLKPKLLLEYMERKGLAEHLDIVGSFRPFSMPDFRIAHTEKYVHDFFYGIDPLCESNSLTWTPQFADSVRYTNASLYEAIRHSFLNPEQVCFSPTSGFHHAHPDRGSGYCTFSGQVIAAVKMYRKFGAVGCFIDLDGHFGNSIEDARKFQPDINVAVPKGFNFNTREYGEAYLKSLKWFVTNALEPAILAGDINYVVWCHGADSHEDDDLGHQCSTDVWIGCSKFFWSWVKRMDRLLGRPLPVSCALFGGYRSDDYTSVLSLHTGDLAACMNELLDLNVEYELEVKDRPKELYNALEDREFFGRSSYYSSTQSRYDHLKYRQSKQTTDDIMLEYYRRMREES